MRIPTFKNKRLLLIPPILIIIAGCFLGLRICYPYHRAIAFVLLVASWLPIIVSYFNNRRIMRFGKKVFTRHARPYRLHVIVAIMLMIATYVLWVLFPPDKSIFIDMPPEEIRKEIEADLGSYIMLRNTMDQLLSTIQEEGLLRRDVQSLSKAERKRIRDLWRDGVVAFIAFDLIKDKYRGFHQIDHIAEPELHADAFFLAYGAHLAQYNAGLEVYRIVEKNEFMATLLDEGDEQLRKDAYHALKKKLTHPRVTLRMHAGTVYYELVKDSITFPQEIVADFEKRRSKFFKTLAHDPTIYIENPLDLLEPFAFDAWFPVQRKVAVEMSYIRTATRDYLITTNMISQYTNKFAPCDIMLQRRNWHMTNIGIPGFWPHTALYLGSAEELARYFADLRFNAMAQMQSTYPAAYEQLGSRDEKGYAFRVTPVMP